MSVKEKESEKKCFKSEVICLYSKAMEVDEKERKRLSSMKKSREKLEQSKDEITVEILNDGISKSSSSDNDNAKPLHKTRPRKINLAWNQNSVVVMFHLHPFFGKRNLKLVCAAFNLRIGTLKD